MVRKNAGAAEDKMPLELMVPEGEAKTKLQERIKKGNELREAQICSVENYGALQREYGKWNEYNNELLKRLFTTEEIFNQYSSWVGSISLRELSLGEKVAELHKSIDLKIHRLDSIIERLELIPLRSSSLQAAEQNLGRSKVNTKKVFVVHGHDEVAKANLEIFLKEIGLEPVVLHRQADEGLTIIEKFEKHSDVGYAFILLTPDEIAYVKSEDDKEDVDRVKEYRARPNVIFEFGYFVGKLSRSKVCCLYTGNVVLPSDMGGIIYKKFVSSIEEVGYSIIKDLKAAGYSV